MGVMRVPLRLWPGHAMTLPIGLELYLKEDQARQRDLPYRTRSQLARSLLDGVVARLPGRPTRVLADGGYATKDVLQDLPAAVEVISRFLISGKLYVLPTSACPPASWPSTPARAVARVSQNFPAARARLAPPA
jgi:hypothetical protein